MGPSLLPPHFTGWLAGEDSADLEEEEWGLFRLRLRDALRHACKVLGADTLEVCRGLLVSRSLPSLLA